MERKWTLESSKQWQDYYNTAPHLTYYNTNGSFQMEPLQTLPTYQDIQSVQCQN